MLLISQRLRQLCAFYKVSIYPTDSADGSYARVQTRAIFIAVYQMPAAQEGDAMHELFHIICYDNNIYPEVHNIYDANRTVDDYIRCEFLALECEKYVDRIAKKLFKKWYPNKRYTLVYTQKWAQDAYRQLIREFCDDGIKRLQEEAA